MDPLLAIAEETGVPIIEDACQAIGATYKGRQAGAMGRVGCFSFFPSKNLGAFGDGGLVTTQDVALGREIRRLRNHGSENEVLPRKDRGQLQTRRVAGGCFARQAAAPAGVDSNAPRECRQVS